ncbi:hypothetical protein [Levilactobacillus namurensis]|uniref:hypothetical protein n=1 Tax=Levilactobacillus namurensis TaxID=380393 RepID=UPI0022304C6A|nr:hypothetical protein [Levilactobacillus namurensis]MCW3779176.1 hypothetical protein [Levilactobacillus namurensis]MDT7019995.1 hypothetical protein [Levilactobacillus namurensis]WNN65428.1 hypothetical protein RIN67_12190 [Levilactobacillus namurensis]
MKKWLTDILQGPTFDATRQAKADIATIGQAAGYHIIDIRRYGGLKESNEALMARIQGATAGVAQGDLLVYQYPSLNDGRYEDFFIRQMHRRGVRVVALIHDIETLRDQHAPRWIHEFAFFNQCDVLIVHSERMTAYLRQQGVTTPVVYQYLLDYLDDGATGVRHVIQPQDFQRRVVLAGNLQKSQYLGDWSAQTPITVFGAANPQLTRSLMANPQVDYRGSRVRRQLLRELPPTFGLAWDGNTATYRYSSYTRYNHPHKVSMYLSHGLPVIVWKEAAVADLIVRNHLGLAIDSLDQLDQAVQQLSAADLAAMLANVAQVGQLIRSGWFTRQALVAAEAKVLAPKFTLQVTGPLSQKVLSR